MDAGTRSEVRGGGVEGREGWIRTSPEGEGLEREELKLLRLGLKERELLLLLRHEFWLL